MTKRSILITGSSGEIGHGLINYFLDQDPQRQIVTVDITEPAAVAKHSSHAQLTSLVGDITDPRLAQSLASDFDFEIIFHLAGLLSTGAEKNPERAHQVNVQGTLELLQMARAQSEKRGASTKFIFPSTIAAYGLPNSLVKSQAGKISEDQFLAPITIYGMNKLYAENLGRYYSDYYKLLANTPAASRLDFRCVRLPGVLSADTVPTGGTSDYGPEILHAAAKGQSYQCFVDAEARLPFMVMPDAIRALVGLSQASAERLSRRVYNVGSFSISAAEIVSETKKYMPKADITYKIDQNRYRIVESWPADVNDSAARTDWDWQPQYDREKAFAEYMIPGVQKRYQNQNGARMASGF